MNLVRSELIYFALSEFVNMLSFFVQFFYLLFLLELLNCYPILIFVWFAVSFRCLLALTLLNS